jgi:hypothetical protein
MNLGISSLESFEKGESELGDDIISANSNQEAGRYS